MEIVVALFLVSLLGANSCATWRAFVSDEYESNQKIMQIILVWTLPVIGALLVLYHSRTRAPLSGIADAGDDLAAGSIWRENRSDHADGD